MLYFTENLPLFYKGALPLILNKKTVFAKFFNRTADGDPAHIVLFN